VRFSPIASPRRLIALAGTLCAVGAGVLGALLATQPATAESSQTAAAASTPRCSTSGLVIWLNTQGNGTLGSVYYQLQFTNLSGRTCTISGYPGVSAVGLQGRQLGRSGSRESGAKARTVTLVNGATAAATLRIVVAGNFPTSSCKQTMAAGLRVYPPNQTTARTVAFPFEACSGSGPAVLSVGPIRKPS
jgi:Protein of unknown function (DUF4232)